MYVYIGLYGYETELVDINMVGGLDTPLGSTYSGLPQCIIIAMVVRHPFNSASLYIKILYSSELPLDTYV